MKNVFIARATRLKTHPANPAGTGTQGTPKGVAGWLRVATSKNADKAIMAINAKLAKTVVMAKPACLSAGNAG